MGSLFYMPDGRVEATMGREIRRVPKGWEHPEDEHGHYKPMYDEDYDTVAAEWVRDLMLWERDEHPDQAGGTLSEYRHLWEWTDGPPDKDSYRPAFASEPTHYQIYETVSEGTPTSPAFETLDDLRAWLVAQGHSEEAAAAFAKSGWAPSMIITDAGGPGMEVRMGIDALVDK
jgi:hypothetical protein